MALLKPDPVLWSLHVVDVDRDMQRTFSGSFRQDDLSLGESSAPALTGGTLRRLARTLHTTLPLIEDELPGRLQEALDRLARACEAVPPNDPGSRDDGGSGT